MAKPSLEEIYGKRPSLDEIYGEKKQTALDKLMGVGGDVLKGLVRGAVDIPVGLANLPVTAHNILHPKDEPMQPFIENPLPEPEGVVGKGTELATSLLGPAGVAKATRKIYPQAASLLTGIEKEPIEGALKDPRLLTKKGIQAIGDDVKRGRAQIKTSTTGQSPANKQAYEQVLNEKIAAHTYGGNGKEVFSGINKKESKKLEDIREDISKVDTLEQAQGFKDKLDKMAKWGSKKGSDQFVDTVRSVRAGVNEDIRNNFPDLAKANDQYSFYMDYKSLFSPKKAQSGFNAPFPNVSIPNIMGRVGATGLGTVASNPVAGASLAALQSPAVHKAAILAAPALGGLAKYSGPVATLEELLRKRGE